MVLENTAMNSIAFAQSVLGAANIKETAGKTIAISFGANAICCLLHSLSRKWGIWVNNFFGVAKFLLLVFIVAIGLLWINRDVSSANYDTATSFSPDSRPKYSYRYAEAFLFVMTPYGGFHQVNYVISELKNPRKTFPRGSFWGVTAVAILYTVINITYVGCPSAFQAINLEMLGN